MSWLIKGGIGKLSELEIDIDKDWQQKEIRNLKAVVEGMAQGDIVYRGADVLERLGGDYGVGYNVLHCRQNGGYKPEWWDIQELIAYLTGAVNRAVALPALGIPQAEVDLVVAEGHSGGFAVAPLLSVPAPAVDKETEVVSPSAVSGGVAHDDDPPADTDETTETNNATASDMHLLPSPAAVGDGFYFGLANPFDWVCLNIGTPGAGSWTITWKYWNGATWTAVTIKYDETNHFRAAAGRRWVHFVRPGDWSATVISGMNLYWIKGECTAYASMTTQPLGTQAWIGRYT